MLASFNGHSAVVNLLLEHGANVTSRSGLSTCSYVYKVTHAGGIYAHRGLEVSSDVVRGASSGELVELTGDEQVNSTGALRVKLADGTGWTTLIDGKDGTVYLEYLNAIEKV